MTDHDPREAQEPSGEDIDRMTRDEMAASDDPLIVTASAVAGVLDGWLYAEHGRISGGHAAGHFLDMLTEAGYRVTPTPDPGPLPDPEARPMTDHDLSDILDELDNHQLSTGPVSRCCQCAEPWPCMVRLLWDELAEARSEAKRLFDTAATAMRERRALAESLDAVTHEYASEVVETTSGPFDVCCGPGPDDRVHRTSARVLAVLDPSRRGRDELDP